MWKVTWRSLFPAAALLLSVAAASQAQAAAGGEKLFGTWVDPTGGLYYAKLEISSDTKMVRYMKGHLDEPYSEARYSIDKSWTDADGNTCYQCSVRWSWVPFSEARVYSKVFCLFGVDATGSALKVNNSPKAPPGDFTSGVISTYAREEDKAVTAIKQLWVNYAAYVETGDSVAWLSQYDPQGIQMRPDNPARGRPELDAFVGTSWKARMEGFDTKMSITPLEIVVTGPWAYSRGTYTQDLTSKGSGKLTHVDGKFLTILKQQTDGSWKIFRDCFNSNVPPK